MEEEEIAIKFYERMMMIVVLHKQENASKGWENTGIPFPLTYPNNPFFFRYAYYIIGYASDTWALPPS